MTHDRPDKGQEKRDRSMEKAVHEMSDAQLTDKGRSLPPEEKRTKGEKAVAKAIENELDRRGIKGAENP